MITYSFVYFNHRICNRQFQELLRSVPEEIKIKTLSYRRWQNQHACLLGKLLLKELLVYFGYGEECLNHLYENQYGKPVIDDKIDFNISHSGNVVVCAISNHCKIGIDVEKKRDFNMDSPELFLRKDEIKALKKSLFTSDFYNLWTQKESLVKAKGVGLDFDIRKIYIENGKGFLNNNQQGEVWYFVPIAIHEDYIATLCCEKAGLVMKFKTSLFVNEKRNYLLC